MHSIELTIGEAVVKVSPETIKDHMVYRAIARKAFQCQESIEKELGIDPSDDIAVLIMNCSQISARAKVIKGDLDFTLLTGIDTIEEMTAKILSFISTSYTPDYNELVKMLNRVDKPDIEHLAPGAMDKYKDMEADEIEGLPEAEKKRSKSGKNSN
jgi:hypothetical protein